MPTTLSHFVLLKVDRFTRSDSFVYLLAVLLTQVTGNHYSIAVHTQETFGPPPFVPPSSRPQTCHGFNPHASPGCLACYMCEQRDDPQPLQQSEDMIIDPHGLSN